MQYNCGGKVFDETFTLQGNRVVQRYWKKQPIGHWDFLAYERRKMPPVRLPAKFVGRWCSGPVVDKFKIYNAITPTQPCAEGAYLDLRDDGSYKAHEAPYETTCSAISLTGNPA